jgi:5-methylcytosine-specific restriction enzyme A
MSRSLPEWKGKTDDTSIPARVKLRIFERHGGHCNGCTRRIGGTLSAQYDHIVPLIAGGANAESNLQLLCSECHKQKTGQDVAEKSVIYKKKIKRLGLKKKRSTMPGSRDSGWKKKMDGTVVKR